MNGYIFDVSIMLGIMAQSDGQEEKKADNIISRNKQNMRI